MINHPCPAGDGCGTSNGYVHLGGRNCAACRAAHARYQYGWRAGNREHLTLNHRGELVAPNHTAILHRRIQHGTWYTRYKHHCHCQKCIQGAHDHDQEKYERKKWNQKLAKEIADKRRRRITP